MKRKAGKREGAARKKSPALTNITRENQSKTLESKSPLYIFGKSHFLNLAKGSCGGSFHKRFEFRVMSACFGAHTTKKSTFGD